MATPPRAEGGTTPQTPPRPAVDSEVANAYLEAANARNPQGTSSTVPWNADVRPVAFVTAPPTSTIGRTPDAIDPYDRFTVTDIYTARTQMMDYYRGHQETGEYANLIKLLRSAGFLGAEAKSMASIDEAWANALGAASSAYASNPSRGSDVFTYLYSLAGEGDDPNGPRGPGGGGGPTQAINLTDPGSAKIMVNQALSTYLGRTANEQELAAFTKALTAQEMANPRKSTVAGDTQITSGGFNPQAFAQEFAQGQEGAAEFQAATGFLDAFIGSLKNPNEVV